MSPLSLEGSSPDPLKLADEAVIALSTLPADRAWDIMIAVATQTLTDNSPPPHILQEYGATRRYPTRQRRQNRMYGNVYNFMSASEVVRLTTK
jgi:hypothetical protein